jgi:hypothetical protein
MRLSLLLAAAGLMLAATAAPALAAPEVRLEGVAARVIILSEARNNITAEVKPGKAGGVPTPTLQVQGVNMVISAGLSKSRMENCRANAERIKLGFWNSTPVADLPVVTVHVPRDVVVVADGAIVGEIGQAQSVNLEQKRCSYWRIGDVAGPLNLSLSGLGDVRAGSSGSALLRVAGLGDVRVRSTGALTSTMSGMGDLVVDEVNGPVDAALSGMGDLRVRGGHATTLRLRLSGMGDLSFGGVADSLEASASGMGSIHVSKVTGAVHKSQSGMASIHVGN